MRHNVFVFGATGKVGRTLLTQLADHDVSGKRHENPTVVVGLADSGHFAVDLKGFSEGVLKSFSKNKSRRVAEITGAVRQSVTGWNGVALMMRYHGFTDDIVYVDATSKKDPALDFHHRIMTETRSKIATANKNPLSLSDYATYLQLTCDPKRYQYSGTTMAGLGSMLPWLGRRHMLGDRIHSIDASLSGTVGYITDGLTQGEKLSDMIRKAKSLGYTEPDYRDDLNGVDVARKLVILAREAGYNVGLKDIVLEPFLPKEYFDIQDPDVCLDTIAREYDPEVSRQYADARARGCTLKYLATLREVDRKPQFSVGLQEVSLASAFGNLKGADNRIEVVTDEYPAGRHYRLEGPGAGLGVTASALREDLINLQREVAKH